VEHLHSAVAGAAKKAAPVFGRVLHMDGSGNGNGGLKKVSLSDCRHTVQFAEADKLLTPRLPSTFITHAPFQIVRVAQAGGNGLQDVLDGMVSAGGIVGSQLGK
jgi:hypothetical protein